MKTSSLRRYVVAAGTAIAVAAVVAIPAADAAKKKPIKPQANVAYASSISAKRGFAALYIDGKRKIYTIGLRAKFKRPDGTVCRAEGASGNLTQIEFAVAKPKGVKANGKYSVSGTHEYDPYAGATATASGKFASAKKAKIVVRAKWGDCKTGRLTFANAVPTGG